MFRRRASQWAGDELAFAPEVDRSVLEEIAAGKEKPHQMYEAAARRLLHLESAMRGDPKVIEAMVSQSDGVTVKAEHWAVKLIAASLLDTLCGKGQPWERSVEDANFVTMTLTDPDRGPIEVEVRKVWGRKLTASEKIAQLGAALLACMDAMPEADVKSDGSPAALAYAAAKAALVGSGDGLAGKKGGV